MALQKTLVVKLKELSNVYHEKNITFIKISTQKDYQKLFKKYIDESIKKSQYHNKLLENEQYWDLVKNQIKESKKADLTKQLFYAFYSKNIFFLENKIKEINKHLYIYRKSSIKALPYIHFNMKNLKKKLLSYNKDISKLKHQEKILKLKEEQSKLVTNNNNLNKFKKHIEKIREHKYQLFRERLLYFYISFSKALQKKDKKIFDIKKNMIIFIEKHHNVNYQLIESDLITLFREMEKGILGSLEMIKGESLEELKIQVLKLWGITNEPIFSINKTPLSIFKLIVSLLVFIIGFLIAKLYRHYIKNLSLRSRSITDSTQTLLSNLGHYFIFIITFFIVLKVLGIDLSSIALIAGALSVGIGFGLQNIISNFVSGIILMLERSVKIGDYIELDENTRGRVTDIKMRSITVNTNSNIDVTIPNQSLIENKVTNWSMNDRIKRFEIPFGVAYGTSSKEVIDVILHAIESSNCKNIFKSKDRYTRVIMTGMGDSSVNFELFIWIAGKDIFYPKRTTSKFLIIIYDALYANNIEIPFPQQDIHIRSIDKSITFKN